MVLSFISHWDVTGYNFYLEIAALILLALISIIFFSKKRFSTAVNRLFILSIICAALDVTADIVGSITVMPENITKVPTGFNFFINGAFYFLQVVFPTLMFIYVLVLLGPSFFKKKINYVLLIPCLVFTTMMFINPFTKWVFYFAKNEAGQMSLLHGPLFIGYYITSVFYFLLTGLYTAIFHKKLEKRQVITIFAALAIIFIGLIIQIILPQLLLTGITISTTLLFIEDSIANPDDMIDKITGVFNYNALMVYLEKYNKDKKETYFLSLDVDNITQINETFGMVTGNTIYGQIGAFCNSLQKKMWAFRVFGSKFILVFKNENEAIYAINRINDRFNKPWVVNNSEFQLRCYIAEYTNRGEFSNFDQFLNYTSTILNETQKRHNSNILKVDDDYILKITRDIRIEKVLAKSLSGNCEGFSMRYQPIFDLKENKFTRAEALIRFQCEEFGQLSPAEFVPLAEKAGLATQLDEYVLRTVCAFLERNPEIKNMDVNVSGSEFFTNPASKFINIIKESKIDPHRICFEITETATINYPEHISEFMKDVSSCGAQFAIDDFGTGYSNVSQLLNQPFEVIKLDKTLLEENEKTRLFLKSINDLFKRFKYPLVIEGVETKEQLEFSKKMGFDYVQGYYFSKPLLEEEFIEFIKNNNK